MTSLVRTFAATDVDAAARDESRAGRGARCAWSQLAASLLRRRRSQARRRPRSRASAPRACWLVHGLDLDAEAFTEDAWKATPLWFAIARGRNLLLAEYLLERGCDPNYALWAAAFNDDLEAIDLLVGYGAIVDDPSVPDETPFLSAVKVSHFPPAGRLLDHGADVNVQDPKGMTALHYMLKKQSDKVHFEMLIAHGARGDIPNREGLTVVDIMRKKRDPDFHELADRLREAPRAPSGEFRHGARTVRVPVRASGRRPATAIRRIRSAGSRRTPPRSRPRSFITNGPYCATGSPIGRACSSRHSTGSSPATSATATSACSTPRSTWSTSWPATRASPSNDVERAHGLRPAAGGSSQRRRRRAARPDREIRVRARGPRVRRRRRRRHARRARRR